MFLTLNIVLHINNNVNESHIVGTTQDNTNDENKKCNQLEYCKLVIVIVVNLSIYFVSIGP